MERNDGQPAAGLDNRLGGAEPALEFGQFVVDLNSERLKGAGGGVDLLVATASLLRPGDSAYDVGKPSGGFDRRLGARGDDGARNAPGQPLFAIGIDDVGQLVFLYRVHQVGGAWARFVHAHIEGAVLGEREPARRIVDLHRRHTEIEGYAVDGAKPAVGQKRLHVAKMTRHQVQAAVGARRQIAIARNRVRVPVDAPHDAVGRGEQGACIAAAAQGAVDVNRTAARTERGDD